MFLGVSGRLLGVDIQHELTEADRVIVANRLLEEQRERFDGVRKAAYIAAGVNPATWTRAIGGQRVRPDRLVQIVKALWPESGGRWDGVPETSNVGPWSGVPPYVTQGDWTGEIDSAMADVDGRFIALEARVRDLEFLVAEMTDAADGDDTLNTKEGEGDGTTTSTQKNELDRARELKERGREEMSDLDETNVAAADRSDGEGDEPPGGSR
jgi:hypothetical protein